MSAIPLTRAPEGPADRPIQLSCAEVWGGNLPVDRPIALPGITGRLFSSTCGGGRGGDVHYLSICGSGLLARMCLADVAGHGEAVSETSGEIHRLLKKFMNTTDQRRIFRKLNRRLGRGDLGALTTAAAFTYYPPQRSLSFSYAGHPPAWFYRVHTGTWSRLSLEANGGRAPGLTDMALAVTTDVTFTRRSIRVSPGDRLFAVTDGVLEAPRVGDGVLFGDERLHAVLTEAHARTPDLAVERILRELRAWTGQAEFTHDDVTLSMWEFTKGPRGPALWQVLKNRVLLPLTGRGGQALPSGA